MNEIESPHMHQEHTIQIVAFGELSNSQDIFFNYLSINANVIYATHIKIILIMMEITDLRLYISSVTFITITMMMMALSSCGTRIEKMFNEISLNKF
jgi:hypothetical protein